MKKALIIYSSRTGTTKKYAESIADFIKTKNIETNTVSIKEFKPELVEQTDYFLFGCWTNGLMICLQHPDKMWTNFAREFPAGSSGKTGLFITFKILTGSMFKKMRKHLSGKVEQPSIEIKSRNSRLSKSDMELLTLFIQ